MCCGCFAGGGNDNDICGGINMVNNLDDPQTLAKCHMTDCGNCRYRTLVYEDSGQYRRCHKRDEFAGVKNAR